MAETSVIKNGFQKVNGKTYYYINNKKVVGQQKKINNKWYYFNASGVMKTNGFQTIINSKGKKKKCYYNKNGVRISGAKVIGKDTFYFNSKTGNLEGRINKITYINQNKGVRQNGRWTHTGFPNTKTWNGRRFGTGACGVTSCAMAITALTGKLVLPTEFNSIKYGFNGIGSNWNVGELTAKKYKLTGKVRSFTKETLKGQLLAGRFVVVWVTHSIYGAMGNTTGGNTGSGGGHFVLIHGYKDGKFAIADPNNLSQTFVWSKKLNSFESFDSHLGNGRAKSYTVIYK